MSDKIVGLIDELRFITMGLKSNLADQQAENSRLKEENERISNESKRLEEEKKSLESEINSLKNDLIAIKNTNITGSEVAQVTNEQIDELVNEIEYCIAQLKR